MMDVGVVYGSLFFQACRGRSDGEEYEDEDRGVPRDSNACRPWPTPSTKGKT